MKLARPEVSWFHLTDEDMGRARRVIDAFKEDDTVDVLGFQPISEKFDDWFYPAVTTPMRRARYYLFVPAIYSALERRGLGLSAFRREAETMQHQLRGALSKTEPLGCGVIGEEAEDRIRRLPSAIYWSAIAKLGILGSADDGRRLGEAEYQRLAASVRESDVIVTDEGVDSDEEHVSLWDPALPVQRILKGRTFSPRLKLRLEAEEADYLKQKFLKLQGGAESLIGNRLRLRLSGPYQNAWDLVTDTRLPSLLRKQLKQARSFSAAARALSLIYYAMVLEKQQAGRIRRADGYTKPLDEVRNDFGFWWKHGRRYVVSGWDVGEFQTLVGQKVCGKADVECFVKLVELARTHRGSDPLFEDRSLRAMVKQREGQKRSGKCRLCTLPAHTKYLKQWGGPPNRHEIEFQLSFRHHRGDTIVRDLLRQPYMRGSDVPD